MAETPSGAFSRFLKPGRRSAKRGRVTCILLVCIFVVALAAGKFSTTDITFDVLNHFRLQLAVGGVAFAVGALVTRARVLTGIVILFAGLVAIGLYPQVVSEAKPAAIEAPAGNRALHVMSFNMSLGNNATDAVLAEIKRVDPDLLMLVEIAPGQRQLMDGLAALYPYRVDCLAQAKCYLAMFSRHPLSPLSVKRDGRLPALIAARLGPEFSRAAVFGLHALRFPHVRQQQLQLQAMARVLADEGAPKLVMGDFNATGFSSVLQQFERDTALKRLTFLPSWPSGVRLPQIGIDQIFVSPSITLSGEARIGRYAGSDHYPVEARVFIPSP